MSRFVSLPAHASNAVIPSNSLQSTEAIVNLDDQGPYSNTAVVAGNVPHTTNQSKIEPNTPKTKLNLRPIDADVGNDSDDEVVITKVVSKAHVRARPTKIIKLVSERLKSSPQNLTSRDTTTISAMRNKRKASEAIDTVQKRQQVSSISTLARTPLPAPIAGPAPTSAPGPARKGLLWSVPEYKPSSDQIKDKSKAAFQRRMNPPAASSKDSKNTSNLGTTAADQTAKAPSKNAPAVKKGSTSKPWNCKQYADLIEEIYNHFPFEDFAERHSKTAREVADVFDAVVAMPILDHSAAGQARVRGGVGGQRVKAYKAMEKEGLKMHKVENAAEAKRQKRLAEADGRGTAKNARASAGKGADNVEGTETGEDEGSKARRENTAGSVGDGQQKGVGFFRTTDGESGSSLQSPDKKTRRQRE